MKTNKLSKMIFLQIIASLLVFACGFGSPNNPQSEVDQIATMVAGTLSAQFGEESGALPTTEVPSIDVPATDVPIPPAPPTTRVAFIDNNNVWLWDHTTGLFQLSSGLNATRVIISDDGEKIAFTTDDEFYQFDGLWSINADGSNLQLLVSVPDIVHLVLFPDSTAINPYTMVFVPGSHTIAFNTQLQFDGPGLLIQNDLNLVDADTGVITFLLAPGLGGEFTYSPDGSQIAIIWPDAIHLINADGSNRRENVIVFDGVITYSEWTYYPSVRWAADSGTLVAAIPSSDSLDPSASIDFITVPLDGTPGLSLYSTLASSPLFYATSQISPDLTKVVFGESVAGNQLTLASMGGGDESAYHLGYVTFDGWAYDSLNFAFSEDGSTYIGRNGFPPILVSPDAVADIEWIANNNYVFTSGNHANWQLFIASPGSPPVLIANPVGDFINFDAVRTP
jgi:hypothetical protein